MSTDWDIFCTDCKERHGFDDCNHWEAEMLWLCKNADTIAGLVELVAGCPGGSGISVGFPCGDRLKRIDADWFRKHLGHNLQPINEYGGFLEQCSLYAKCGTCDYDHKCSLQHGHAEPCLPRRSP